MSYSTEMEIKDFDLTLPKDFFEVERLGSVSQKLFDELVKKRKTRDITLNELDRLVELEKEMSGPVKNKYGFMIVPERVDYNSDIDVTQGVFYKSGFGEYGMMTNEGEVADIYEEDEGFKFHSHGYTKSNYSWVQSIYESLLEKFKGTAMWIKVTEEGTTSPKAYRDGKEVQVKVVYEY